jgi:ATP-binding cassette subfamily B protein
MTVIIVSQRVSSIANADRILVIDEGMVVGDGTHNELVESCPIYRELYTLQCPEPREGGSK